MINEFKGEYAYLSNFYLASINYDGIVWPTSEHLYQAAKFSDRYKQIEISKASTPGKAKYLGQAKGCRDNWEEIKVNKMYEVLKLKFGQNKEIKEKLIATHPQDLVEGNYWHDNFWGACTCKKCKNIKGFNVLGRLLMKLRYSYLEEVSNGY